MVPFLVASLAAQLALFAGVTWLRSRAVPERSVEVKILPLRSPARAAARQAPSPPPPPPPARVVRAERRNTEKTSVTPLVAPKVLPDVRPLPPLEPPPEPSSGDEAEVGEPGGVPGGEAGGIVGGTPGGVVGGIGTAAGESGSGPIAPSPPIPARPRDLEGVRERIARTLRYPPRARDLGWEGRCLVEFVLLADGTIRNLHVIESSERSLLDEAALAAVQRAVPFPPPGMDVLVRTPIAFRLH